MKDQTTAVPDEYVLRNVSVENSNLEIAFLWSGIVFFVVVGFAFVSFLVRDFMKST